MANRAETEEEVKLQLASELIWQGWYLKAERKIPGTDKRYDLGLCKDAESDPVALIEVKKGTKRLALPSRKTKQRAAYESCGLPYTYCRGVAEIEKTLGWAWKKRREAGVKRGGGGYD